MLPPPAASPPRLAALVVVIASTLLAASPAASATTVRQAEGASVTWVWPLDPPRMIVRPYLAPPTPYAAGHRGIDIGISPGADAQVRSPADGVVHFAGVVVDRPVLSIRHSGGLLSSFEPVTTDLVAGAIVRRGDRVGVLQAGHCTRPCLHFGVRLNGEYLSPLNYLGGIPHSVLLPTRPLS
ncbi:MAG TPA: M23 family metallopeptidase [Homoserinimonas sp.]|nr:M23 family metallopeptidase [Homoserinimonas sp.]